jgi:hypothetical protein
MILRETSPKGFSASKCDVGNWIFFGGFFKKLIGIFWRIFLGGIFWEEFFGRIFWEEFFVSVVKVS